MSLRDPATSPFRMLCAVAAIFGTSLAGYAADPAADLENQYQTVLSVLNRPSVSGVLVTEVQPESAAAAAGVRGGDIITNYYGVKISDLRTLREQVAEAVARRLEENSGTHLLLRARRGAEDITLQMPREPLGIRAVEVEAGVPGPRNPPSNARGTLNLDWNQVLQVLAADNGAIHLRIAERQPRDDAAQSANPADSWLGWERYAVSRDGADGLSAKLNIHHVDPTAADGKVIEELAFTFTLRLGDFTTTPAFLLNSASARYPATEGDTVNVTATRAGELLNIDAAIVPRGMTRAAPPPPARAPGEPAAGDHHAYATPLTALIQAAVPLVAAAMPHDAQGVMALHLLSVRDFIPRPGYVLASRGQQPLPAFPSAATAPADATAAAAWRVDLLHCGTVIESYWFSDQRRLLCIQSDAAEPVISRRVATEAEASMAKPPVRITR